MTEWNIDLSAQFWLAYELAGTESAHDLGHVNPKDALIARDLGLLIPELDARLRTTRLDYDDTALVMKHLLEDPEYGFDFYDFGPLLGDRCRHIVEAYNQSNPRQKILDIHLVDASRFMLDAAAANVKSAASVKQTHCTFDEFRAAPIYLESDPRLEFCGRIGEYVEATCITNLERKILFFGGTTINNFSRPISLIRSLAESLTCLDIMVVEIRHSTDYSDYPGQPRPFVYEYARKLGFLEFMTDSQGNSTMIAINESSREYGFTLTKPFTVPENHPLTGKHPAFKAGNVFPAGTSFLLGYNRPYPVDKLISSYPTLNGDYFTDYNTGDIDVMAYRMFEKEAIVYITHAFKSRPPVRLSA